jgi:hypothetical protein
MMRWMYICNGTGMRAVLFRRRNAWWHRFCIPVVRACRCHRCPARRPSPTTGWHHQHAARLTSATPGHRTGAPLPSDGTTMRRRPRALQSSGLVRRREQTSTVTASRRLYGAAPHGPRRRRSARPHPLPSVGGPHSGMGLCRRRTQRNAKRLLYERENTLDYHERVVCRSKCQKRVFHINVRGVILVSSGKSDVYLRYCFLPSKTTLEVVARTRTHR